MNILPKIAVPSYTIQVPSTKKTVKFRPYLVKEEKILMIAIETEDQAQIQNALIEIIKECFDDIEDPNQLTIYDMEYLFVKLRAKSVGESVEITRGCDHCEGSQDVALNLDNITIENNENVDLRVVLQNDFIIDMRYPVVGDNISDMDPEDPDTLLLTVGKCINKIFYGEDTFGVNGISDEELLEFIGNLSTTQFAKLVVILLDAPKVSLTHDYKCMHCEKENNLYYTGLLNFFT
ncbi:MAG TPA: hypothetical protein EYM84_09255 [Flavobacteriales bacterium]|jgi:hypothetical protein|nr:hypothetical protein [Flavobacteriales bacterium]